MMRELITNDFESANIQYIKFWVMDPYAENTDHEGGDLYFNLETFRRIYCVTRANSSRTACLLHPF